MAQAVGGAGRSSSSPAKFPVTRFRSIGLSLLIGVMSLPSADRNRGSVAALADRPHAGGVSRGVSRGSDDPSRDDDGGCRPSALAELELKAEGGLLMPSAAAAVADSGVKRSSDLVRESASEASPALSTSIGWSSCKSSQIYIYFCSKIHET